MLPHEVTDSPKKNVQAPTESPDLPTQSHALALQQAQQLLDELDYTGAIKLIQRNISEGMDEQVLAKEYLQAANASLGQTSTLMQQGHYSKAAHIFTTVQESYPQNIQLQRQITVSATELTSGISLCTAKLMEEGLAAYRSGKFVTAIDLWEQVLKFNPGHQAAQNSIQTTRLQMANLKSMDSKH